MVGKRDSGWNKSLGWLSYMEYLVTLQAKYQQNTAAFSNFYRFEIDPEVLKLHLSYLWVYL